ncbi:MAG: GAF domain-containing protein, partial [Gemmatimonadaceae bacterium]
MRTFLTVYARSVGALGLGLLVATLVIDTRWMGQTWGIVATLATILFLRAQQIPLTKYGALNLLALPVVSGALILGAPAASLAIYVGVLFADVAFLRRSATIAWINAGREVLALISAYGAYAWASVSMSAGAAGLSAETLPPLLLFVFAYFVTSRLLLYFTLLVRDKLVDEEKSLILRYEVVAFGAGTIGVMIVLVAVTSLKPIGWAVVGIVLVLAGLLLKRILEESIAAEELNKILAMEQVVSSDVDISDAFRRIQELAHRLVDWRTFRIGRLDDGELLHVWEGTKGYLDPPCRPDPQLDTLRREALHGGDIILVTDTLRDARILAGRTQARSVVVIPLRFGERTVGLLELEHHKADAYSAKEVALIRRFANQLATTLHIYDLRRPLLEAMNRVSQQLDTLTNSARALRGGGESVARTIGDITRGIAEEGEQVGR